eukprot:gene14102-15575_t
MSTKYPRKQAPTNRMQNRPTNRSGKPNSSQNFGRPQSRDYPQTSEPLNADSFVPDFSNPHVAASVVSLVGSHVLIHTSDNQVYDGILNTVSPSFVVCLTHAHFKRQEQSNAPNRTEILPEISFNLGDIICIKCKNVDLDFARKDSFQIDSMISSSNGPNVAERKLMPWKPDKDAVHVGSLSDMQDIGNGVDYDELKRANEEKFNFTSTFNEATMSKYMDAIETDDKEKYLQRERDAMRVVKQLEMEDAHQQHDVLDSGMTEEEQFSSVKRPASNSSPNRNANIAPRGNNRRSHAPGFANYREPSEREGFDSKLNRNSFGTSKRITNNDEAVHMKPSYSQLVQRSQLQQQQQQQDRVAQHGSEVNQLHHRMANEAAQNQLTKSSMHQQHSKNLPPRLQQSQQQQQQHKMASMDMTNQSVSKQQQTEIIQANSKPRSEPQQANDQSVSLPVTDQAKSSSETHKNVEDIFNHENRVNRTKYGKSYPTHPPEAKEAPNVDKLKQFSATFQLPQGTKNVKPNKAETKEVDKAKGGSLVIKVSPEPPVQQADERLQLVEPMPIKDETTEDKNIQKEQKDEDKQKEIEKADLNKVVESKSFTEATSTASTTQAPKKGLNPNAKEFQLNPNANEFVPTPASPSPGPVHMQSVPSATRQYPTHRMVATSSPPVYPGNIQQMSVMPGQASLYKNIQHDHVIESPGHQSFIPQQQQQHPPLQQQQQQPVVLATLVPYQQTQPSPQIVTAIPQQGMPRTPWHPSQAHPGAPSHLIPQPHEGNSVFLVGNHIMTHQQASQPIQAYSPAASQQLQQMQYMVASPHYSQIASPINSNTPQSQMMHGIQRPPTPQHMVHSATPTAMHPGQQMVYGTNQMAGVNFSPQQAAFVPAPRGTLKDELRTFEGIFQIFNQRRTKRQ